MLSIGDKIVELSSILQKSEYDIFSLAAIAWFGREINVYNYFVRYIINGEVPYWVRDYTRKELKKTE